MLVAIYQVDNAIMKATNHNNNNYNVFIVYRFIGTIKPVGRAVRCTLSNMNPSCVCGYFIFTLRGVSVSTFCFWFEDWLIAVD